MLIAGMDEAGRGPWAGPMVVGCVVLEDVNPLSGLADSKSLTAARRRQLYPQICKSAAFISVSWASAPMIDRIGLTESLNILYKDAFARIDSSKVESVIVDGDIDYLNNNLSKAVIKADTIHDSVMAASIVAKVLRDKYMEALHRLNEDYGFASHKGYGTSKHRSAIMQYGVIAGTHRLSYKPIKKIIAKD